MFDLTPMQSVAVFAGICYTMWLILMWLRAGPPILKSLLFIIPIVMAVIVFYRTHEPSPEAQAYGRFLNGEVQEVARAPDGTTLWKAWHEGRTVFFSSKVAEWNETYSCGTVKQPQTCNNQVQAPNTP